MGWWIASLNILRKGTTIFWPAKQFVKMAFYALESRFLCGCLGCCIDFLGHSFLNSWIQFHDFVKIHGFNSTIFEKFVDYIPKFCIFAAIKPHEP